VTVVLLHGGLWEEMDAERFWVRPGIAAALRERGLEVAAPDRLPDPLSWAAEVAHLLALLPAGPVQLVAGSNGCSVAARIAVEQPGRVDRLVLAWPATVGDSIVDTWTLVRGAPEELLAGETLRGLTDVELVGLRPPVAIVPSLGNRFHQRSTVDDLLALVAGAVELPACPEPPRPEFPPYLDGFVSSLADWLGRPAPRTR
jgi:pimeloyl-ACP methyl ester carboxylesterase